jgi:hypothetical protein
MAAYPKPTGNTGTFNNQSFVHPDTGGLTIDEAKAYFVTYPNTQSPSTIIANNFSTTGTLNVGGTSQFGGDATFIGGATITGPLIFSDNVEVDGTTTLNETVLALSTVEVDGELTVNNNIILNQDPLNPGVKTFIQFSDLTVQDTAFVDANYAQKNESNTFISPYIQTFQGSNSTLPTTAPLQFSNVTTSEYGSLYVDPGVNNDLTIYSNQSGGGLTVRNSTNSFTINPTTTNTATFLNPIATNSSITGNNFNLSAPSQDAYSLYLNSVGGYGLVVANTTPSGFGTLTLSNNGSINTTLTATSAGLVINTPISVNGNINMNNYSINNINTISGYSSNNITCNSTLNMGTGKSINMNSNNITNIGALAGITGVVTVNSAISMGSGNAININNSTLNLYSGTIATNIGQSVGQSYFNNTAPFANSPSFSFALYKSTGFSSVLDLSPTTVAVTTQLNMNSQNIINCNSITNVSGQYVTTNTPPDNTIPTAIATTQYVANNAPIYLQSSFTNVWSGTSSISPSTVNVITTRIASTNIVSFNNVNVIVNSNAGLGNTLIAQFQFNTNPWATYPPASGAATSISVYCNTNGATYSCQTAWFASPATLWISYPPGAPTSPCQFTVNLSSFGAFAG